MPQDQDIEMDETVSYPEVTVETEGTTLDVSIEGNDAEVSEVITQDDEAPETIDDLVVDTLPETDAPKGKSKNSLWITLAVSGLLLLLAVVVIVALTSDSKPNPPNPTPDDDDDSDTFFNGCDVLVTQELDPLAAIHVDARKVIFKAIRGDSNGIQLATCGDEVKRIKELFFKSREEFNLLRSGDFPTLAEFNQKLVSCVNALIETKFENNSAFVAICGDNQDQFEGPQGEIGSSFVQYNTKLTDYPEGVSVHMLITTVTEDFTLTSLSVEFATPEYPGEEIVDIDGIHLHCFPYDSRKNRIILPVNSGAIFLPGARASIRNLYHDCVWPNELTRTLDIQGFDLDLDIIFGQNTYLYTVGRLASELNANVRMHPSLETRDDEPGAKWEARTYLPATVTFDPSLDNYRVQASRTGGHTIHLDGCDQTVSNLNKLIGTEERLSIEIKQDPASNAPLTLLNFPCA
ncbi:hypothetical protein RCL1_000896 [Eukaryota sp. TZLM3-RCL]